MIKPLIRKNQDKNTPEPKKSLSFFPLVSAIICGFSYFQTLVYLDSISSIHFTKIDYTIIHFTMMSPGFLLQIIFYKTFQILTGIKFNLTEDQFILITYVLSSIIPAISGWMLGTKNKSAKITGIILFILFILTSIFSGMLLVTIY